MPRRPNQGFKRALDIIICILSMPLVLPLGLALAGLICLEGRGKPFYLQERIGQHGQPFRVYKFRTMVLDAEERLEAYLKENPEYALEWEEKQKLRKDPRLTSIGCFLRKTSLDELPQLINILKGNMTLVGPRPIVQNEKRRYGRYFREYCLVKPGLTGLWQTKGRNNTTYLRRVACDHYYINNWTPLLDLWIMLRTIPAAFSGNGAY